jgi:hypothetical protein
VVSRFDANVIYHGGNVLLRSTNRGKTWSEASPDLTRNDRSRQGPGGAPITNEGAGGETYGVIHYIAESPHAAGTLWVGTDDGLVQLTRDDGKTWSNVTPPDVGEAMEEVTCAYNSPKMEIGYNARYLLDILRTIPGGDVTFLLDRSDNAGVVVPEMNGDGMKHECLLMPLRLGE